MELTHIAQRSGRLSSFLRQELGLSTGLMNRLKWSEGILVNGTHRHADYPVAVGDTITALLDDPAPQYPAQQGNIHIVYEDEHILCVDKPSGMLIHPSRACNSGTLANFVLGYYQKTGQSCAFHPVTRLDRDTFGIVLLAKNSHIHARLNALHREGRLQKQYEALVFGCPEQAHGVINAPIARKAMPSLLREIRPDGKPSQTEYRVTERWDAYSCLCLTPLTGRTHQLRVHCAHIGCPILGDPQYGSEASRFLSEKMGYATQVLCAKSICFPHPVTGKPMQVTSGLSL